MANPTSPRVTSQRVGPTIVTFRIGYPDNSLRITLSWSCTHFVPKFELLQPQTQYLSLSSSTSFDSLNAPCILRLSDSTKL